MQGGAIEQLAQGFYNETLELSISPRRRQFNTTSQLIGAGATLTLPLGFFLTDLLQAPGDAYLFDLLEATLFGSADGLLLQSASVGLGEFAISWPLAQPVITLTKIPSAVPQLAVVLQPTPPLWTVLDLDPVFGGAGQFVANQPAILRFQVVVNNPTAAAITLTLGVLAWTRFVRGLQEG
jgi:hypothetical protein